MIVTALGVMEGLKQSTKKTKQLVSLISCSQFVIRPTTVVLKSKVFLRIQFLHRVMKIETNMKVDLHATIFAYDCRL